MKPPPFEYYAPTTIEEALDHLAEHGYDAKPLAGGQSLIPMMNFRLAQPSILVDLNNISELSYIRPDENGGVLVGAIARHKAVGSDPLIAKQVPLVFGSIWKRNIVESMDDLRPNEIKASIPSSNATELQTSHNLKTRYQEK